MSEERIDLLSQRVDLLTDQVAQLTEAVRLWLWRGPHPQGFLNSNW